MTSSGRLSQIFGDGNGNYPAGAWLDQVLVHAMSTMEDVEAAYEGYLNPDPKAENIGALAALVDLRDGTNLTGLNPKEEKLIRHIGFSGHNSPAVMMEMIHRDERNVLDGMLVAINANDRLHFNMQYNVIPVAAARNMGLIAHEGVRRRGDVHQAGHLVHQARTRGANRRQRRAA